MYEINIGFVGTIRWEGDLIDYKDLRVMYESNTGSVGIENEIDN